MALALVATGHSRTPIPSLVPTEAAVVEAAVEGEGPAEAAVLEAAVEGETPTEERMAEAAVEREAPAEERTAEAAVEREAPAEERMAEAAVEREAPAEAAVAETTVEGEGPAEAAMAETEAAVPKAEAAVHAEAATPEATVEAHAPAEATSAKMPHVRAAKSSSTAHGRGTQRRARRGNHRGEYTNRNFANHRAHSISEHPSLSKSNRTVPIELQPCGRVARCSASEAELARGNAGIIGDNAFAGMTCAATSPADYRA